MHVVMGFQLRITSRHLHFSQYVPQPATPLYHGVCSSSSTIAFYQPPTPPPDSILSKPYSDNLLYHHQTFKDLKFVWQQPLLQQRPLVSSKVRQQTIKGFTQTAFPTTRRCNPHRPNHLPSPSSSLEYSYPADAWMTRAPYATIWDFRWGQMPNRRPGMGGTVGTMPRYELHASYQRTRIGAVAQKVYGRPGARRNA